MIQGSPSKCIPANQNNRVFILDKFESVNKSLNILRRLWWDLFAENVGWTTQPGIPAERKRNGVGTIAGPPAEFIVSALAQQPNEIGKAL